LVRNSIICSAVHLHEILCLNIYSTLIGMCCPGKNANFLKAKIELKSDIAIDTDLCLTSDIDFLSSSTQAVQQDVKIINTIDKTVLSTGTVTAKINKPAKKTISMQDIISLPNPLELTGKTALISGSSRGIGSVIAKLLASKGAAVVINYRSNKVQAEKVLEEIISGGGKAFICRCDVSDRQSVNSMVKEVIEKFGGIDIFISNAVGDTLSNKFKNLHWNDIQSELNITLKGAFNCVQEIMPIMIQRGGGNIVAISSVFVERPPEGQFKYVIAKSSLTGFIRAIATEYGNKKILANIIEPSMSDTDLTKDIPSYLIKKNMSESPQNRLVKPIEIANTVLYLVSELNTFVNGQKIIISGGAPPFL